MKLPQKLNLKNEFVDFMNRNPELFPLSGDEPSDDAIQSLIEWGENKHFHNEEMNINELFEVLINAYINENEFVDDELGETYTYCKEQLKYIRSN